MHHEIELLHLVIHKSPRADLEKRIIVILRIKFLWCNKVIALQITGINRSGKFVDAKNRKNCKQLKKICISNLYRFALSAVINQRYLSHWTDQYRSTL